MSIFDASVQDDWARDDLIAKIKAAEKKYYNESPCLHCGPGNGCDDCRGCEDAKRNYELEKALHNAIEAYKAAESVMGERYAIGLIGLCIFSYVFFILFFPGFLKYEEFLQMDTLFIIFVL